MRYEGSLEGKERTTSGPERSGWRACFRRDLRTASRASFERACVKVGFCAEGFVDEDVEGSFAGCVEGADWCISGLKNSTTFKAAENTPDCMICILAELPMPS